MTKLRFDQLIEPQLIENKLMRQALTHRSAGGEHNERLEFLGDAVLGMLVAEYLYKEFPNKSEGELTRLRSYLVRGEMLSSIARDIDLSKWLIVGKGEEKTLGQEKDSLLEDALEAVIGAIYLLCGYTGAATLFDKLFTAHLEDLPEVADLKDAKTQLQELLQARNLPVPEYQMIDDDKNELIVSCHIDALQIHIESRALSRRKAEQKAAAIALRKIEELR